MDNQFHQPGSQGGQIPQGGYGIPAGYGTPAGYGAPAGYGMPADQGQPAAPQQPGYPQQGAPQGDPYYAAQQPGYRQPYEQPVQQPYGGAQAPYAEDGYQHYFDHSQSVMQPQQPAGFPQQQLKPQKPRLQLTAFHWAIILVTLGFLGWYLYANFAPEAARYGQITSGSLSATHRGDCLIVRNEVPFDAEGVTSIVYDAEEGAAVVRSDKICKVYSSGYSSTQMDTLMSYREKIRDYQKNKIESETTRDDKLDNVNAKVVAYAKEVRSLIGGAQGSLTNQEELLRQAVADRQLYLKSKYASDQRYARLYDDEISQSQRIDSWTKQYTATKAGVVSFYSDGYEYALTGETYTAFEPREVRAMFNGDTPEKTTAQKGKTTIYRMVEDGEWYVLFLSRDTEWNPVNGQLYALQLERFENTHVTAEVVSFTRSGGELLVRLKISGSVKPVLYMRTCEALLGESLSTLCVPERAIHTQDGMTGVVIVDNQTESFIPVDVLHYADGNAYFQAIQQGLLFEGMTVLLF